MRFLTKYPLGLAGVAFAVGAAVATLILGIPALWSQEAAGWAGASVTFLAVIAALITAFDQRRIALEAVRQERETQLEIQQKAWDAEERASKLKATRLAHAFSRELAYARRLLIAKIIDWDPDRFVGTSRVVLDAFVEDAPLPDLLVIRAMADRLDGFSDDDAMSVLNALTAWQFYNRSPGISVDEITARSAADQRAIVLARLQFGLELVEQIEALINRLAVLYEGHSYIEGTLSARLPDRAQKEYDRIRKTFSRAAWPRPDWLPDSTFGPRE